MSFSQALLLAAFGGLLLVAFLLDDIAARIRLPGILLVLLLGLLTNNDLVELPGEGAPSLLTLARADQIAQLCLVLVLFFGGLTTNWSRMRRVLKPAIRLATAGSLITALLLMVLVLGLQYLPGGEITTKLPLALFVGAMVCSTDASAVLAVLRPLAGRLPPRMLDLIECESAFNDPVAVVLAGVALALARGGAAEPSALVVEMTRQFLLGALLGFLGGSLSRQLFVFYRSRASHSLLAVLSLAELLLLVGGTQLLGGSGLLAAFVAGLVLGNSPECDTPRLVEAHAGFAKMAELILFLSLGLVVEAKTVVAFFGWSLLLFGSMQVARFVMVELLLLGSGFSKPERSFVTLSGLRGAVPIAMAIQAAAGPEHWGRHMPALALGVVLLGLLGQGLTLVPLAGCLGLTLPPEPPPASLPGAP